MDAETRRFIENSTLLFIASRNTEGAMDVSPRGGQPGVLRVIDCGTLLLPDYQGNRRLDTIGNLLGDSRIALVVLNRNSDRYLRIGATARVSFQAEHLSAFPADENPPICVLEIEPEQSEWVETSAFGRSGFWQGSESRKPPLDLGAIIRGDNAAQADAGLTPIYRDSKDEARLAQAGVRSVYGQSSELVQSKVYDIAGPGGLQFIEDANFFVVAHEKEDGSIGIDLSAEAPFLMAQLGNRHIYRVSLPSDVTTRAAGECALAMVEPGRSELLRINGRFEQTDQELEISPREIFFHCSAAFARSRVWQSDRRSFWTGKRRFTCFKKQRENPEVVSFVLVPDDDAPLGPVMPGQYVTVSLRDGTGVLRQRSYSVSSRPDGRSLRISVRRTGGGGVSDLLHDAVAQGDTILVGAPTGRFVLSSPPGRAVVLVSAGVGITPLLPMLQQLAEEDSGSPVWFVHAARDGAHHLFADEARNLARESKSGAIRLVTFYSRPDGNDRRAFTGRIDAASLAKIVPVREADFYLCGPEGFMFSLHEGLVAHGAAPENVHFEAFAAAGGAGLDLSGKELVADCVVSFEKTKRTATWTPACGSLLDLALENGVDVSYSCRVGDCQSCAQRVVTGVVDYPLGEVPVLAEDQVLLCQAVPRGNLSIDC